MTSIADRYLKECSAKRCEPYCGFIKSIHEGVVDCDLDFVPADDIRRMAYVLTLAGSTTPSSSATAPLVGNTSNKKESNTPQAASSLTDAQYPLRIIRFARGIHRDRQHPPVRSSTTESYRKLLQTYGEGSVRATSHTSRNISPSPPSLNDGKASSSKVASPSSPPGTLLNKTSSGSSSGGLGSLEIPHFRKGISGKLTSGISNCIKLFASALLELHLVNVDLDAMCVRKLAEALVGAASASSTMVSLRVLNLSNNPKIEDQGVMALASAIPHLQCLTKLELRNCSITNAAAKSLVAIISSNASKAQSSAWKGTLRSGATSEPASSPQSQQRSALTHLDLSGNYLGGGSSQGSSGNYATTGVASGSFMSSFVSSPTFSSPSNASFVGYNKNGNKGDAIIASPHSDLGYTNNYNSGISDFARDFLDVLKSDDSVTTLILRNNIFTLKEIIAFAEHFCSTAASGALTTLDLNDCSGMEHITDLSPYVGTVDLNNPFTNGGMVSRGGLLLRIGDSSSATPLSGTRQKKAGNNKELLSPRLGQLKRPSSSSHHKLPTPLSVAAMRSGGEDDDGAETYTSEGQLGSGMDAGLLAHKRSQNYPTTFYPPPQPNYFNSQTQPFLGVAPSLYGWPAPMPPSPAFTMPPPPPPPPPPVHTSQQNPSTKAAEKDLAQWSQAAYQQLILLYQQQYQHQLLGGGPSPFFGYQYPYPSQLQGQPLSQQAAANGASGVSFMVSPPTPANKQLGVTPPTTDHFSYPAGNQANTVDNGPVNLQELLLGASEENNTSGALEENKADESKDLNRSGLTDNVNDTNALPISAANKLNNNFEKLLREFMAKMEMDDEHKTMEMEQLRHEIQAQQDVIESLQETVKKNETKLETTQKENSQKIYQLSKTQANQQILGQQRPPPQFIVKETPRSDQELLMSHLSTEFALLIGQGIRKIEKQIDPNATTTSSGTTAGGGGATTGTLSNRLPLSGTGTLSLANANANASAAKKTSFEDEVANRLAQLGW